jgi:hypothetical protein
MSPDDKRPLGQPPGTQPGESLPPTTSEPAPSAPPYGPVFSDNAPNPQAPTPMPNFAEQPIVIGGGSPPPRKRGKKLLFIIALLLVLVGGGAAAYAYYSQPSKVIGDALSNAAFSDTAAVKGTATIKSEENSGKFTINFDAAGSDQTGTKANVQVKADMAPVSIDLSAGFLTTKAGDLYFKIDKAKEILQNVFGASNPEALKPYDSLIALVDNKWVKVTAKELGDNSLNSECYIKLDAEAKQNKSIYEDAKKAYEKNQFITIEQTLDSETVSGKDSIHYKIKIDEAKLKSFITEFKKTQLYKKLQDCDKTFELDEDSAGEFAKNVNKSNIEVWVSRWSHEFTKFKLSGSEDGTSYEVVAEPTWNQPVNIEEPKDFTPWQKVMDEYEKILTQTLYGGGSTTIEPSVESARTFRFF